MVQHQSASRAGTNLISPHAVQASPHGPAAALAMRPAEEVGIEVVAAALGAATADTVLQETATSGTSKARGKNPDRCENNHVDHQTSIYVPRKTSREERAVKQKPGYPVGER